MFAWMIRRLMRPFGKPATMGGGLVCGHVSLTPRVSGVLTLIPRMTGEVLLTPSIAGKLTLSECC